MTDFVIPEEAVEAAAKASWNFRSADFGVPWEQANEKGMSDEFPLFMYIQQTRVALEAALPHLRVQETPRKAFDVGYNIVNQLADLWEVPVDVRQAANDRCWEFAAELVASAAPLPRPVVDREALREAIEAHRLKRGPGLYKGQYRTQFLCECGAEIYQDRNTGEMCDEVHSAHVADAVLALLPNSQPTPSCSQTGSCDEAYQRGLAEAKDLAEVAGRFGYELGRKEALAERDASDAFAPRTYPTSRMPDRGTK